MSETTKKVNKTVVEENEEVEAVETEKVKKAKKEAEKPGIFKRMGNWCKRNKKSIFACAGSFVGGAGAAIGGSMLYSRHQEKKRRNAYIQQPQEPTEYSPLDPNVE